MAVLPAVCDRSAAAAGRHLVPRGRTRRRVTIRLGISL